MPGHKVGSNDPWHDGDPHLAAVGHDVHGAVIARGDESAVAIWGVGQAVDLALQCDDLLPGVAKGGDESRVVVLLRGQFTPNLGEGRLQLTQARLAGLVFHDHP